MTIAQILKLAAAELKGGQIDIPPLEAEILLAAVLKKPREFLLAHGEYKLKNPQISKFQSQISRRLKGEPVAYLTGHKEFYGLDFKVNKNVLIPRPETELLLDEALKRITRSAKRVTIVDVGTGSGCVIISLIKNLISKFPTSNFQFLATDISAKALAVARQNAKIHGVNKKIKFTRGHLIEPIIKSKIQNAKSKIFLANLPYGWKAWKNNCSMDTVGLKFEPAIALFSGKNGLELYEKLFKQIIRLTHDTKYRTQNTLFALCEFDPRQTRLMKRLIKKYFPPAKCQIKKDLAGHNRLAIIKITPRLGR